MAHEEKCTREKGAARRQVEAKIRRRQFDPLRKDQRALERACLNCRQRSREHCERLGPACLLSLDAITARSKADLCKSGTVEPCKSLFLRLRLLLVLALPSLILAIRCPSIGLTYQRSHPILNQRTLVSCSKSISMNGLLIISMCHERLSPLQPVILMVGTGGKSNAISVTEHRSQSCRFPKRCV